MLGNSVVGTQARCRKKEFSAIKEHAEKTGHDILEKSIKNHKQRETWHSIINKDIR